MLDISDLGVSARGRGALKKLPRSEPEMGTQRGTGRLLRESAGLEAFPASRLGLLYKAERRCTHD